MAGGTRGAWWAQREIHQQERLPAHLFEVRAAEEARLARVGPLARLHCMQVEQHEQAVLTQLDDEALKHPEVREPEVRRVELAVVVTVARTSRVVLARGGEAAHAERSRLPHTTVTCYRALYVHSGAWAGAMDEARRVKCVSTRLATVAVESEKGPRGGIRCRPVCAMQRDLGCAPCERIALSAQRTRASSSFDHG